MVPPIDARASCECDEKSHHPRLVVVTGGPGAGKTVLLEAVRRTFCHHVVILPEAAGIVFGGGFPRRATPPAQRAAQRAIFRVQRELERLALEEGAAVVLCDRGTLDGLAYWPSSGPTLYDDLGIDRAAELARYHAVVHLRTPPASHYSRANNPLRVEDAFEAAEVDARLIAAWDGHPERHLVNGTNDFFEKLGRAVKILRHEVPKCCRVPEVAAPS